MWDARFTIVLNKKINRNSDFGFYSKSESLEIWQTHKFLFKIHRIVLEELKKDYKDAVRRKVKLLLEIKVQLSFYF